MPRISCFLLLSSLLGTGFAHAQTAIDTKKPSEPAEAEVRFLDGSVVRMFIMQDTLEVTTPYGKLNIPTRDIQHIDVGVHLPEGMEAKVAQCIEQLNNDNYKMREAALKQLVTWGPYAYPQLYQATKADEPEVAKRASTAVERIRAKYPPQRLRTRGHDIIVTPTFTVVGRITTPLLKAKSENFGELTLELPKVRVIRWMNAAFETQLTVDAEKYGSLPDTWYDTGFEVQSGVKLVITATGSINLWPQGGNNGGYMTTARGYGNAGGQGGNFRPGTLLAKIGFDGPVFAVTDNYEGMPTRDGKLYLHIVPSPWNNASAGSYQVKILPRADAVGE
jgi:hypothetical protein